MKAIDLLSWKIIKLITRFVLLIKPCIYVRRYGYNIKIIDQLIAAIKTAEYVLKNMDLVKPFKDRNELLRYSLSQTSNQGLILEFGVHTGASINHIASLLPDKMVYGFDSFEGLPEAWGPVPKGHFKLDNLPKVEKNVKLIVGLFQDTLKTFLEEHTEKVAFIHLDADLYSASKYVLSILADHNRIQESTVIEFDEFFYYRNWWMIGEYKAFVEFVEEYNIKFRYIGYTLAAKARPVSVKILRTGLRARAQTTAYSQLISDLRPRS